MITEIHSCCGTHSSCHAFYRIRAENIHPFSFSNYIDLTENYKWPYKLLRHFVILSVWQRNILKYPFLSTFCSFVCSTMPICYMFVYNIYEHTQHIYVHTNTFNAYMIYTLVKTYNSVGLGNKPLKIKKIMLINCYFTFEVYYTNCSWSQSERIHKYHSYWTGDMLRNKRE